MQAGGAKRQKGHLTPSIMARLGAAWAPKAVLSPRGIELASKQNEDSVDIGWLQSNFYKPPAGSSIEPDNFSIG